MGSTNATLILQDAEMLLGCIANDLTGAKDLALLLLYP